MESLFAEAKRHIEDLERRYKELVEESRKKDEQLIKLSEDVPVVWITGPERGRAKKLLVQHASEEDGLHPLRLDTKYYTADVLLSTSHQNQVDERNHAVIVAFADTFHRELAEEAFDAIGEVRICICDDAEAADWCVQEGVEWIEWNDAERVMESLSATMWPNLVMKEKKDSLSKPSAQSSLQAPKQASGAASVGHAEAKQPVPVKETRKRKDLDEAEELEMLENLMVRARQIRDSAPTVSDAERRRRAAEAAEEMIKMLGLEDESDDET